jgi:hypothetical protein
MEGVSTAQPPTEVATPVVLSAFLCVPAAPWLALRRFPQLFANHLPRRLFECRPPALDEGAERAIDKRLVAAVAGAVELVVEVLQDVLVQADGDPFLPGGTGSTGPRLRKRLINP